MRTRFLPYKIGSQSCKMLAKELDILRCNPLSTRFRPRPSDLIINWGCSQWPFRNAGMWLNYPSAVRRAANKIDALLTLQEQGVSIIPFTTSFSEAKRWLQGGNYVYQRHLVNSCGGNGIKVVHSVEDLNENVPLYTKGIPIRREYRVHVFGGKVIDHVQKRRTWGAPETDAYVRNHTHGWIFCREGFERIEEVETQALNAVTALGLDFGAVDIITEKFTGNVYVLEVNTAIGFTEGSTTFTKYVEAIKEYINNGNF